MDNQTRFLTTAQAAQYLGGLRSSTLEVWRLKGVGPKFLKFQRQVRYAIEDLDEYVAKAARNSTSEKQA